MKSDAGLLMVARFFLLTSGKKGCTQDQHEKPTIWNRRNEKHGSTVYIWFWTLLLF
jgi:hypothetical protein